MYVWSWYHQYFISCPRWWPQCWTFCTYKINIHTYNRYSTWYQYYRYIIIIDDSLRYWLVAGIVPGIYIRGYLVPWQGLPGGGPPIHTGKCLLKIDPMLNSKMIQERPQTHIASGSFLLVAFMTPACMVAVWFKWLTSYCQATGEDQTTWYQKSIPASCGT